VNAAGAIETTHPLSRLEGLRLKRISGFFFNLTLYAVPINYLAGIKTKLINIILFALNMKG